MGEPIFKGRTALVAGGAAGIGGAVSRLLARDGAAVAIQYHSEEEAARQTLEDIQTDRGRAILIPADATDEGHVSRLVGEVHWQLGPVDLLVNAPGGYEWAAAERLTLAEWKRMQAVHLDGPFLTTWAVKDEMIARRFGRIVNVSAMAALMMEKDLIHFSAANAGLIGFTRSCAEAFAPFNVRVNGVAPGLTEADAACAPDPVWVKETVSLTPLGRPARPEEVAAVVRFLLSDESSFITGQTFPVCGGRY